MTAPLLSVSGLSAFLVIRDKRPLLDGVSVSVAPGEVHGLLGESGAGKSTLVKAVLGLLPKTIRVTAGQIRLEGTDLITLNRAALRQSTGSKVALVPQDPSAALNPGRRIGPQVTDSLRLWRGLTAREADDAALAMLAEVQVREPARVMRLYPHELSGGMRQRVIIAAAFALEPKLIIADEPTTALDVTVQKQILRLIRTMQRSHQTAVLFVTHDLGVAAQICDDITLLYRGKVAESGPAADFFEAPKHPYAQALHAAARRQQGEDLDRLPQTAFSVAMAEKARPAWGMVMADGLIEAIDVVAAYPARGTAFTAKASSKPVLKGVTVRIGRGEIVGIVGESGSGKSTLGRTLLRLLDPISGVILFDGADVTGLSGRDLRRFRRCSQMIFQDPMASLNPRRKIGSVLRDTLLLHELASSAREANVLAAEFLQKTGLDAEILGRYPHQLSGGQRQRAGIARALLLRPSFVLADEIVSGLDASTQAQVLRLLVALKIEMGLSIAFISHDLSVVRALCDRVYVLLHGVVVEEGDTRLVFQAPAHPYTRSLIDAIPPLKPNARWLDT